jgi:hypothetical protein
LIERDAALVAHGTAPMGDLTNALELGCAPPAREGD